MPPPNDRRGYGPVSKGFHWTIAILIVAMIGLGWYMVGLTYYDPWYNQSLSLHKAVGMIVLALAAAKLAWTLLTPQPASGRGLSRTERVASRSMHGLLMLLMVVMPVTGYLISTSAGDPVSVFGIVTVPPLFDISGPDRELAITVHFWTTYGCGVLALLHAGAALKHHLIDRDDTLRRMT